MLLTRCPHCDTTFRVTDEALNKAKGQVRCGRCASVFDAYAQLHEQLEPTDEVVTPPPAPKPAESGATKAAPRVASSSPPAPRSGEPSAGGASFAALALKRDATIAPVEETTAPEPALTPAQIDAVLSSSLDLPGAAPWAPPRERRVTRRWWIAAATIVLATLGAQAVHHWRQNLVEVPLVGSALQSAYALLGSELRPSWNVKQYRIIEWQATAEPNERGDGSLRITARISNDGPRAQPYPQVKLKLKDRWEAVVASRTFGPSEYLDSTLPSNRLMSPGETARAQIEVLDPGPDAYGFELDVCIEAVPGRVSCGTDDIFL